MNKIMYSIRTNVLHNNMVASTLRFTDKYSDVHSSLSAYDVSTFITVNDSIKNSIRKKY